MKTPDSYKQSVSLPLIRLRHRSIGVNIKHITMDGIKKNPFLDCARGVLRTVPQHHSTASAALNLVKLSNWNAAVNIIGHGVVAEIFTNFKKRIQTNDPKSYIGLDNIDQVRRDLRRLKGRISSLALWACYPGTGEAGASMLYEVAKIVDAEVAGPTGNLFCQDGYLWLEPGSTLQVATPDFKPSPIDAPTVKVPDTLDHLKIKENRKITNVPADAIRGGAYSWQTFQYKQQGTRVLSRQVATEVAGLVDFTRPFITKAEPAAISSAALRIDFKNGGRSWSRTFSVYNHRLFRDDMFPTVFYRTSSKAVEFLIALAD